MAVAEWACWKFLAITTAIFAYGTIDQMLSANLTGWQLMAGRIIGVGLFYLMIDAGVTKLLKFLFRQQKAKLSKEKRTFYDFVLILVILKVIGTATTSFWAAPEVSEVLTEKGKEDQYIAALLKTDSLQRSKEQDAQGKVAELENSRDKRLKKAKQEGATLLANAVATGNHWQQDSYRKEGMGWLTNPANPDALDKAYAKRIKEAKAEGERLLAAVDGKTLEATAKVVAIQSDTAYQRTATLLADAAKTEQTRYEAKLERRTNFVWLLDLIAVVFGLLLTRARSLREKAAGDVEAPKRNIFSTLSAASTKMREDWLDRLERLLNIDINGDGSIGGQTAQSAVATTPTATPTPNPQDLGSTIEDAMRKVLAAKQPIVVAGFQQNPTGANPTPPPPVAENRGSAVATTSTAPPQPVGHAISHNSHKVVTEVVEDLEGVVMELCDKFKKEWPTRWRQRVANGGNLTTMQTNFRNWHDLLNTYLDGEHKPLSQKAQGRVEEFRRAYRDEILPTITTPQQNQQP